MIKRNRKIFFNKIKRKINLKKRNSFSKTAGFLGKKVCTENKGLAVVCELSKNSIVKKNAISQVSLLINNEVVPAFKEQGFDETLIDKIRSYESKSKSEDLLVRCCDKLNSKINKEKVFNKFLEFTDSKENVKLALENALISINNYLKEKVNNNLFLIHDSCLTGVEFDENDLLIIFESFFESEGLYDSDRVKVKKRTDEISEINKTIYEPKEERKEEERGIQHLFSI